MTQSAAYLSPSISSMMIQKESWKAAKNHHTGTLILPSSVSWGTFGAFAICAVIHHPSGIVT